MATAPKTSTVRRPAAKVTVTETNGRGAPSPIRVSRDTPPERSNPLARLSVLSPFHHASKIPALEKFLKREEADVILFAGNVVLVAFELIEWPVAALTLLAHALARSRYKALHVIVEVAEECD